jgi:drug/metabolite transporter (DMT)-like permease
MASLLALGAAFSWGAGDSLGGLASRRIAVVTVLAISQAAGLAGLLVWVLASGETFPGIVELAPAVAAGAAAIVGLAALYRGFALGAMGIVAPISVPRRSFRSPSTPRTGQSRAPSSSSASRARSVGSSRSHTRGRRPDACR